VCSIGAHVTFGKFPRLTNLALTQSEEGANQDGGILGLTIWPNARYLHFSNFYIRKLDLGTVET